jgi:acetolactate synthase I/II/III large subunit
MATGADEVRYGSDLIIEVLRDEGVRHVSLNPGATIRGLHESIVHAEGRGGPSMLLCTHEEIAIGLAHGYAKVTGEPVAVGIHDVVGLQHASMAIFNAWVDRVPMVVLGGTGPMDQAQRRPRIDWIHTAYVQGQLVRDYVKWENQVFGVESIEGAVRRAVKTARTRPYGPVYVCFDVADQEAEVPDDEWMILGKLAGEAVEPVASSNDVERVANWLAEAQNPLIVVDHYSVDAAADDVKRLVALAEKWAIPVIDSSRRFNMPSQHPLALGEAKKQLLAEADLIIALDVRDLFGTIRLRITDLDRGRPPLAVGEDARIVSVGVENVPQGSWVPDYFTAEHVDCEIPVASAGFVRDLLDASVQPDPALVDDRRSRLEALRAELQATWKRELEEAWDQTPISTGRMCAEIRDLIERDGGENWVLANWSFVRQWPFRLFDFDPDGLTHIGTSGGEGLGYGLSASLGAALACKETGKIALDIQGDGDLMYVTSALWTAAAYDLPLLVVVHNNRSYYRDAMHQGAVSDERGRGHESVNIGIDISGPDPDFGAIARGHGVWAEEVVEDPDQLGSALQRAVDHIKQTGKPALVDVISAAR